MNLDWIDVAVIGIIAFVFLFCLSMILEHRRKIADIKAKKEIINAQIEKGQSGFLVESILTELKGDNNVGQSNS